MDHVKYSKDCGVGLVTLNRPAKLNAFYGTMREDLLAVLTDAQLDPAVRVVLITGAGRGFCGGGDVAYMNRLREQEDIRDFSRILDAANAVARTLFHYPKPTIAAVNGPAAGGGANLALGCDIRLGSSTCSFTQSFVKIGLGPDWGGSFILPLVVGADRARELLLTGRTVAAEEAYQLGLIHRLVEPDLLITEALQAARELSGRSAVAIRDIKGALRSALGAAFESALEFERSAQLRCFLTAEARDAFAAFSKNT